MQQRSPYNLNNSSYYDTQELATASNMGTTLAEQLIRGNDKGLPQDALNFLAQHALGVGAPTIGAFRDELAKQIDNQPWPYDPVFVRDLGETVFTLMDVSNDLVLSLQLADIEATAQLRYGSIVPNDTF